MNPIVEMVVGRVTGYLLDRVLGNPSRKEEEREAHVRRQIAAVEELERRAPSQPLPTASPAPEVAATSQVEGKGKGCLPCSADHLSTVAGALSEALRFARGGTMEHPEVMSRLAQCFDELNIMERIDAAPEVVAALPEEERELMQGTLVASRGLRHILSDVKSLQDLERAAAEAQRQSRDFRGRLFRLNLGRLAPETRQKVKDRAHEILEQGPEQPKEEGEHGTSPTGATVDRGEPGGSTPGGRGLPDEGEHSPVPG